MTATRPPALFETVAGLLEDVAASEVMPRWRNLGAGDIAEKSGPEDIVTIADRCSETALTRLLADALPGSLVVGEEAAAADPGVLARLRSNAPVWVIDPIDGTSAFAAGDPQFAIMVALVEQGAVSAGWILAPALGVLTYGGGRHGVWHRAAGGSLQQLPRPAVPADLAGLVGLLGRRNISDSRRAELQAKAAHFKALDGVACAGIDYPRLALGNAHFALYSKSEPWDHLPGLGILAPFGFRATQHDGTPYRPGDNTGGLLVAPDDQRFESIRRALID